jgi:PKD domain
MNSYRIYSRRTMGLDNRIWFVMLGAAFLLEGFFVYKIVNPATCPSFSFSIKTLSPRTDTGTLFKKEEAISFTSSVNNENITWDFGDNTENLQGRLVTHRFSKDGSYVVKARLNSICDFEQTITVAKDPVHVIVPVTILGSDSTVIGKDIELTCPDTASLYDWGVQSHGEIPNTGNGSKAKFKFPLPGPYTITVKLNGDITRIGVKTVNVTLKPVKINTGVINTPPPQCALPIPYEVFANELVKVMRRESDSGKFGLYLCKGDSTPVTVNPGKRNQEFKFGDFCQRLSAIKDKDKKNMRITIMGIDRDDETVRGKLVSKAVQHIKVLLEISSSNIFNKTVWNDYKLK